MHQRIIASNRSVRGGHRVATSYLSGQGRSWRPVPVPALSRLSANNDLKLQPQHEAQLRIIEIYAEPFDDLAHPVTMRVLVYVKKCGSPAHITAAVKMGEQCDGVRGTGLSVMFKHQPHRTDQVSIVGNPVLDEFLHHCNVALIVNAENGKTSSPLHASKCEDNILSSISKPIGDLYLLHVGASELHSRRVSECAHR